MGACDSRRDRKSCGDQEKIWAIVQTDNGKRITKGSVRIVNEQRKFKKIISQYFDKFDIDHDGLIDVFQLEQLLKIVYEKRRRYDKDFRNLAKIVIQQIDHDNDHKIILYGEPENEGVIKYLIFYISVVHIEGFVTEDNELFLIETICKAKQYNHTQKFIQKALGGLFVRKSHDLSSLVNQYQKNSAFLNLLKEQIKEEILFKDIQQARKDLFVRASGINSIQNV